MDLLKRSNRVQNNDLSAGESSLNEATNLGAYLRSIFGDRGQFLDHFARGTEWHTIDFLFRPYDLSLERLSEAVFRQTTNRYQHVDVVAEIPPQLLWQFAGLNHLLDHIPHDDASATPR